MTRSKKKRSNNICPFQFLLSPSRGKGWRRGLYKNDNTEKEYKFPGQIAVFISTVSLILFSSCSSGPDPVADHVMRDFEGLPGVYTFRIPPGLVNMVMQGMDDQDVKDFLSGMETIKVIIINAAETTEKKLPEVVSRFIKALDKENFEDLRIVNQGGDKIVVKIHEEGNNTNETMITSEGEFPGLSLVGDIEMTALGKIVYKINQDDFNPPAFNPPFFFPSPLGLRPTPFSISLNKPMVGFWSLSTTLP